jgi:acyl-CoA synthetase (AMP-forming)/AMP-acid ligase II
MEYNLADLFEAIVDVVPDREALICGDRRLTYAQTDERANRLAHHLAAQGIGPGDHVALLLYNGTEYLEGMLAAFKVRAVPVNVNYRYREEELRYLLDDSDARAIVFHREFAPKLAAIHTELPLLTTYLAVDDESDADLGQLDTSDYETALADASAARDFPSRSADDLYILYTGGTTGNPKGVMWRAEDIFFGGLGGGNLGEAPITRPEEIVEILDERRRTLPACPLMHGTAHWFALGTLYAAGTVVLSPDRHLDPVRLWELIAREQVTFLVIVGDAFARPLVEALDSLDPSLDLSSLTVVLSGGAILSPAIKQLWVEKLPGCILIDGFGSSESGGQGSSVTVAGGPVETAPRFRVDDETTVLDDDLRPAAVGAVGKLARRGHVPLGYYKDAAKTAATFPVVDGVRWSVPGDHARIEEDGTITVLGRGSVSINTGGEKVYPEEVESVVKSHDAVFDVVVVGVPDARWGERVVAVAQLRPGASLTPEELTEHVRERLASYKAPRDLVVVDTVLRSPSGKPDYRWARAQADAAVGDASVRPSAPR